jgi:peroxiredoxin
MRRFADPVLLTLLVASLAANVYFVRHRGQPPKARPQLQLGAKVPEFTATRIDGGPLAVRYRAKPVILYIFSPACHWCERNLRNANALAVATRAEYEFVGLSLTDANLEKYVRENRIGWDVGSKVPASAQEAFGMGGTPETIVVGPGGTVLHVWQGAFVGTVAADIQRAFGVRLPGLEPEASSIGD